MEKSWKIVKHLCPGDYFERLKTIRPSAVLDNHAEKVSKKKFGINVIYGLSH